MKKKWIITGLTCVFLLLSGISYSCAYRKESPVLLSTALGKEEEASIPGPDETDNLQGDITGSISEAGTTNITTDGLKNNPSLFRVHICGAVQNPGVYQVEDGSRLVDLIKIAGGLTDTAAGDYINQAAAVTDGQRIYIPDKDELKDISASEYQEGQQGAAEASGENSLININTADAEALMSLPGIGQAKADNIIAYRAANSSFKKIEDLMNVPGIKQGLFGQISSRITVD